MVNWLVSYNGGALETFGLINWYSLPNTGIALSPISLLTFGFLVDLQDNFTDCTTPEAIIWVECAC
jgi:hypothetical protein